MLQGKDLILATKPYTKENRSKSWLLVLSTLFLLSCSYSLAVFADQLWIQIPSSVFAGLLVVRMFVIYHDYLHKAILQGSAVAKLIFTLFGMFILAPTSVWKRSHDYHHQQNCKLYTSSIGSFPLATKEQYLASSRFEKITYLFIRHPLTIALGYIFAFFWGMCLQSILKSSGKHMDSYAALIFHFGISWSIFSFFGGQSYVFGMLIPALISSAIGSYLFYSQHNYPDAKYSKKEDWSYASAALNSSSFLDSTKFTHWITANIGYHHIHHINARIPFYNLPNVYKEMEEFKNPGKTSLSPSDLSKCLRLKLWDAENNKMISLKEI